MNKVIFLLAHGAGAPSGSEWMNQLVETIQSKAGNYIEVQRFNFDYMEKALRNEKKYPPDRMPKLLARWKSEIESSLSEKNIFIGGKSMGGRAATLLDQNFLKENVKGIANFGFPFHAPGKLPGDRIRHLEIFEIPCLINQGERDPMGTREEIYNYNLSNKICVKYIPDGNHDLKPRVKSGLSLESNLNLAVDNLIEFINKVNSL